jgi:hypothetical protein
MPILGLTMSGFVSRYFLDSKAMFFMFLKRTLPWPHDLD